MTTTQVTQQPADEPLQSNLPGVNVMLMGPSGSGKTHSLGTAVEARPEVDFFLLALEPGVESIYGYFTDRGKPIPKNLHVHVLEAPKASFSDMLATAKNISQFSLDALAKMADPNKAKHDMFIKLLTALNNFVDQRTGESFGSVASWGTNRCLMIDGMDGIGRAAMSLVVGGKAVRSQSDWGMAQDQVEKLLRMLTADCKCHFIILAHVEREQDLILGGVKLLVATLGKALAPKIPQLFSDVILAVRSGSKWTWDTASVQADVKTRNLPIASNNEPTFKTIFDKWESRGGRFTAGA